ncbi:MAG: type II secretion system F family protein [Phycisphaeraceae bacterium]|nr:type II secretion system F family protein [Phycisphaeraceae bacterium]MCW5754946.1 type II secretion system F family protein [Phycisphaeraceae bacterium]
MLLESGIPLAEALRTLEKTTRRRSLRRLLRLIRDGVTSGHALSASAEQFPDWFDQAECAMLRAGEEAGELIRILYALAQRRRRSGDLLHRFIAVLTYPALVLIVGTCVAVYLSTRTLPQMLEILHAASIPVPALTNLVITCGQAAAAWWWLLPIVLMIVVAAGRAEPFRHLARALNRNHCARRLTLPRFAREAALADLCLVLAELLRAGLPLVDAMRCAASVVRGPGSFALRNELTDVVHALTQGHDLSESLRHPAWFDAEFRQLICVAEEAGELHVVLERIGERRRRSAERRIDRVALMAEPAAIVALSLLVGLVVLAAVLPLVSLQNAI